MASLNQTSLNWYWNNKYCSRSTRLFSLSSISECYWNVPLLAGPTNWTVFQPILPIVLGAQLAPSATVHRGAPQWAWVAPWGFAFTAQQVCLMAPLAACKAQAASKPGDVTKYDILETFVASYLTVLHQTWLCAETKLVVIFTSLARLETRMTADINVILQLLQRQIAPVPPAYSTVSSGTLPTDSPSLYGNVTPVLDSMYSISPRQVDSRTPTQVKTWQNATFPCNKNIPVSLAVVYIYSYLYIHN